MKELEGTRIECPLLRCLSSMVGAGITLTVMTAMATSVGAVAVSGTVILKALDPMAIPGVAQQGSLGLRSHVTPVARYLRCAMFFAERFAVCKSARN